jgi:hypothetical protein
MERRNLDLGVPLTREQWLQIGEAADFQPDNGVLEWTPADFGVIHVSIREDDAPKGWQDIAPAKGLRANEREVARFVYNDGRPMVQLEPPMQPEPPAVLPQQEQAMQVELERWVRGKWHVLMRAAGLHDNVGAIPEREPDAVD